MDCIYNWLKLVNCNYYELWAEKGCGRTYSIYIYIYIKYLVIVSVV
jgi:hypothetical protein